MSYQNINQYNYRRLGLIFLNEITDLCLASDEKSYDQEVIFSPLLIGEDDGNRLPFKFDFNSTGTTLCQLSPCSFDEDTIVSENYWNPLDVDPNYCPKVTELCNVGLTGIDNGLVKRMSGETIEITTGLYTNLSDKFSRYKYDRRMKMHPITGFTTPSNRLWDDNSYDYNLAWVTDNDPVGYYSRLFGGFFQGFYKLPGYDYQIFPQRVSLGWTAEFMLRYRWTGNTSVGLNVRYPDNKGTFFFMGARAENKFYHYADGHPKQDTGYTRVTSGLTCMHTCECLQTGLTAEHSCLQVYQPSGGTLHNCSCCGPCQCSSYAEFPETDPLYDGVSNALSLRLSGDTGNPRLCVKTYRITGACETSGVCTTGLTYVTGTTVSEWCSTRGIFDNCKNTTYINVEHWVQIDAVFQRYEWFDTCDLYDKGGLGLIVEDVYTATSANNSVNLVLPPITHEKDYDPATTEIVTFNDNWTLEEKFRLGTLKFYVNGKLFMVAENFEEIIPRLLNTPREKQIGVSYNISLGGGTQGLHDNLTFSGGCPEELSGITYQQDPECLTTHDLDNTIYSGLTTHIRLEEIFGGSLIGDISAFRMYTEPLNAGQIGHNFRILKNRYDLLDPSCPNCAIIVPACDFGYEEIPCSETPTVTPTNTPTVTPTPTEVPAEGDVTSYVNPGSVSIDYFCNITSVLDQDFSVTFTQVLGTITGSSLEIRKTINIPAGSVSGFTSAYLSTADFDNLDRISGYKNVVVYPPEVIMVFQTIFATPTPTPTCTETPTPTQTQTPTNTSSLTPTQTQTPTNTGTQTQTPTKTPTQTQTPTKTPTQTQTPTKTPTQTQTPTKTQTPTNTGTPTQTATNTETPTQTPTNTSTPTNTPTPSVTEGLTPTATGTQTPTPSITASHTPTKTQTPTQTPTRTPTQTPTNTSTQTPTNTSTQTPTNTETPTQTSTQTPTQTPTNTSTQTPTNTETPTQTATNTMTPTPSTTPQPCDIFYTVVDSNTIIIDSYNYSGITTYINFEPFSGGTPIYIASTTLPYTWTGYYYGTYDFGLSNILPSECHLDIFPPCDVTPIIFQTQTPTNTPTPTQTPTNTSTQTPTNTSTQTQTPTNTSTQTPTNTPTQTPTNTSTQTPTNTPTQTPTNTSTQTPTRTQTQTPTQTNTPTNTSTQTPTPTTPTLAPNNVSNLQGWYDANNPLQFQPTNPLNAQLITQWGDSSGLLHNLNSSGANEKPTYYTNIQNGKPGVYFNGTTNTENATNYTAFQSSTGLTIFVTSRFSATTGTQKVTTMGDKAGAYRYYDDAMLAISGATPRYQIGGAGAVGQDSTSTVDTVAHVHTIVFDGSQTGNANRLVYRRDKVQQTLTFTGTVGATTNALSNILFVSPDNLPFNGYGFEIAIYNRALTSSEINSLENYFKAKWGTP